MKDLKIGSIEWRITVITFVVASLLLPAAAFAQEAETEAEHHDDHHYHPNHFGVFLGAATPKKAKSETSFALGFEYERRFNDWIGAGGVAEFLFGEFNRDALALAGVYIHPPLGDLTFFVAPGAEWVEKSVVDGGDVRLKRKTYFVMRLTTSYLFHAGSLSISPMFAAAHRQLGLPVAPR